jgi:hypothetical protein
MTSDIRRIEREARPLPRVSGKRDTMMVREDKPN